MKNQVGSARLDTVLKMLMITFISFLAFSFGVYFGKAITTSDHQLKAVDNEFKSEAGKVAERTKNLDAKGDDVLIDEEVASLSDKYVSTEKEHLEETPERAIASEEEHAHEAAPAKHGAAGHDAKKAEPKHDAKHESNHEAAPAKHEAAHGAKSAARLAAEPVHAAKHEEAPIRKSGVAAAEMNDVQKAARRVASNEPPTEEPVVHGDKESRTPTSLPKTVGAAKEIEWTVQVASYPTAEGAKSHVDELTKKGFPAYPVEAKIGGKLWYRVSVGSFKSQSEATNYLSGFRKQAGVASAIVQKVQR